MFLSAVQAPLPSTSAAPGMIKGGCDFLSFVPVGHSHGEAYCVREAFVDGTQTVEEV